MKDENSEENKEQFFTNEISSNKSLLLFSNVKKHIKLLNSLIGHIREYFDVISVFSVQLNELNLKFLGGNEFVPSLENSPILHIGKIIKDVIQFQINNLLTITKNQKAFDDIADEFSNLLQIFKDHEKNIEENSQNEDKPNSKIKATLDSLMEKYEEIENKIIDQYISKKYNKNVDMKEDIILDEKIAEVHYLEKTFFGFEEISKKNFIQENQEIEKKASNCFNILKDQMNNFTQILLTRNNINLNEKQNEINFIWENTKLKEKDYNDNLSKSEDLFKYSIKIIKDPIIYLIDNSHNKAISSSKTQIIPQNYLKNKEEKKKTKLNFFKIFNKDKENNIEEENKEEKKKKI